ncbi:MAG TPA: hypothetical protein VFU41_05665 [Gemmatimonadales bacterium]|nr:hypothetical protein [Gemmatimonadales bacterium]
MQRRLTAGLALLRTTGCAALILLFWNPVTSRVESGDASPPLVLLDASLSMSAHGGRWREALDTARALARGGGGGGVIWRFGRVVRAYDSLPPSEGATRLAPALAAAAGRGGPVVVVTDGAVADVGDVAPDVLRRVRAVVLARPPFFDAFVASVDGPRRMSAGDTIRLTVSYGTAGIQDARSGMRDATLSVTAQGRRLAARPVALPDSGVVSADLTLPASRIPHPGWTALEVRLEGVDDDEPRDDARLFLVEVSALPSVVLLAAPPDWDTRFLARALGDVARVPVRTFVEAEPGAGRWRDAATLTPVSSAEVSRAAAGAQLVVRAGDPTELARVTVEGARASTPSILSWPTLRGQGGDWYVQPPGSSPLAGALAGIAWDSLPPVASLAELSPDSAAVVVLSARLARRGPPRPMLVLSRRDGARRATIAATGLYRWAFRGGASAEAYRALVAALADWLLAEGARSRERFRPVTEEVPNGMPVAWTWTGVGAAQDVAIAVTGGRRERVDTLRFDATGHAELHLPTGVYRYVAAGGPERGSVAVDGWSDEWQPSPAAPVLRSQDGAPLGRVATTELRDRWWLFVVAIAAFAAEWAWRRRQGLP